MPSPYRSKTFRQAARAAALQRIRADERTPEQIEEELAAARQRVEDLEQELADARPNEENARLDYAAIYGRQNRRLGARQT